MAFGRKSSVNEPEKRVVNINTGERNRSYAGNATSTTKYSIWTFLPKALFEQYRRVANIYFTIVAALSLTPYTPVRAWTTWTPLIIVLGVAMIKEAVEDYKRYKLDKEINNRAVEVLDPEKGEYVSRTWKEVHVGDIVLVTKDQQFPADLLFLTSETEEGTCYIETMNLDGETNLKIKKAPDETKDFGQQDFIQFRKAVIECEGPNARLYQFTGNLLLDGKTLPIIPAAILLRGCNLRNTDKVVGAVIYAGHETKIFKNAAPAPSKRSHVERIVDKIIFFMFFLLFSFCICGAVYFATWTQKKSVGHWYLEPYAVKDQYDPNKPGFVGFASFITSFILYGYLIPISLYVSMELVKIAQSMGYINNDLDMYHADTDTPALARTSNLNEELGMVNTIMSDKTGTLTRNVMEFFKCSIAGVAYGAGITEIEKANALRRGTVLADRENPEASKYRERFFNFYDERLMGGAWSSAQDPATIEMFFRLLAVCHTVIPDGPPEPATIKYEAESPDEAALVVAAKAFGFFFHKRTNTTVTVRERTSRGEADVEYEVLNILEFNSTRKRMSVVIKDKAQDKIIIFTKGADTVIYERLDPAYGPNEAMKASTGRHMEEFGAAGLRTLCLSYAEVDREWYSSVWLPEWVAAKTSLTDRDAKVADVSEKIERNLRLLGCTAIEDKLQEGVPECIRQLAMAGIRIWVLTGDKMETAINIGFACSLLTEEMHQFTVSASSPRVEELEKAGRQAEADALAAELVASQLEKIEASLQLLERGSSGPSDGAPSSSSSSPASPSPARSASSSCPPAALIIDGKALSFALSQQLSPGFLRVGLRCRAVVCCRVSPLQKAQVTQLVRRSGSITLAVGDGANDVGMIQRAHIGVGISGQEGMQAVMSADFVIAQFRFLVPLLLVHGQYSYRRITRMINFFFYKNLLFAITLFTYSAFTTFSGSYVYNDTSMTLFNVLFTSATPLLVGMFDRHLPKAALLRYPQLYTRGARNADFNLLSLLGWLAASAAQSGVILLLVLPGAAGPAAAGREGMPYGMAEVGVILFTAVVLTVHLHLAIIEEAWTWLHHAAIWGSVGLWYVYLLAFGRFPVSWSLEMWMLFEGIVARSGQFWLFSLLVPTAAVLPTIAVLTLRRLVHPSDEDIIREMGKAQGISCSEEVELGQALGLEQPRATTLSPPPLPPAHAQDPSRQHASPHPHDAKILALTQELLNSNYSDISGPQQHQMPNRGRKAAGGGPSSPRLLLGSHGTIGNGSYSSSGGGGGNRIAPEPTASPLQASPIGGGGGSSGARSPPAVPSPRRSDESRDSYSHNRVARTTVTTLALQCAQSVPNPVVETNRERDHRDSNASSAYHSGMPLSSPGPSRLGTHSTRGRGQAAATTVAAAAAAAAAASPRESGHSIPALQQWDSGDGCDESHQSTPPGAVGWQADTSMSGGAGGGTGTSGAGAGGESLSGGYPEGSSHGSRTGNGMATLPSQHSTEDLTPRRGAALLASRGNLHNLQTSLSTPVLSDALNGLYATHPPYSARAASNRTRVASPMQPTASVTRGTPVLHHHHHNKLHAVEPPAGDGTGAGAAPTSPCPSVGPERSLPSHTSHLTAHRSLRDASAAGSAASSRPASAAGAAAVSPSGSDDVVDMASSSVMRLHRGSDGRFTGSGPQLLGGEEAMAQLHSTLAPIHDGAGGEEDYMGSLEQQNAAAAGVAVGSAEWYELPPRRSVHDKPLPMEDLG